MKLKPILTATAAFLAALVLHAQTPTPTDPAAAPPPLPKSKIQIAILLDTSSSMDGLINQARTYLWQVVSDCALAKHNGVKPDFEVSLYQYGNSRLDAKTGWIEQLIPLTNDLDLVSEKLFKLNTSGGSEHCGQVIDRAADDLAWSKNPNDLKMIFIAGNEPFDQGPVKYQDACKKAATKGISVNTILCGGWAGDEKTWKDGALLADGSFLQLNHNQAIANIPTPFDDEINKLNQELNKTYVVYGGKQGEMAQERQVMEDAKTAKLAPRAVSSRAMMKASKNYLNDSWDLVDAAQSKDFKISSVKEEELPEEMRKMNDSERKEYLAKRAAERAEIQKKMNLAIKNQQDFIATERAKDGKKEKDLGDLLIETTRQQAEKREITFEKP